MSDEAQIEIRAATSHDAQSIRELVRSAYARWVPLIGREPLPMQADYEHAVREHRFDIITIEGEMAALIETVLRPDHLWIENLAVRPERQRQGLGRRLLAHAERHAVEQGRVEARLQTNAAFAANVTLYTRLGYDIYKEEPFRGGVTVYMKKTLA